MQKVKENFSLKGKFKIIGRDCNTGKIVSETPWSDNLIMFGANTGRDLILDRLAGMVLPGCWSGSGLRCSLGEADERGQA